MLLYSFQAIINFALPAVSQYYRILLHIVPFNYTITFSTEKLNPLPTPPRKKSDLPSIPEQKTKPDPADISRNSRL